MNQDIIGFNPEPLELTALIVMCSILLIVPLFITYKTKVLKAEVNLNEIAKSNFYKTIAITYSLLLSIVIFFTFTSFSTIKDMGLNLSLFKVNTTPLGNYIYLAVILFLSLFIYQIFLILMIYKSPKNKTEYFKARHERTRKNNLHYILPKNEVEHRLYFKVFFFRTIVEEIVYRGFLIFVLLNVLNDLDIYSVILLSSILYGFSYLNIGVIEGIVKKTLWGALLALIAIAFGSVVPTIVFSLLVNYTQSMIKPKKIVV